MYIPGLSEITNGIDNALGTGPIRKDLNRNAPWLSPTPWEWFDNEAQNNGGVNDALNQAYNDPNAVAQRKYDQDKKALADKMVGQAKDFRGNIPGYEQTLYSQLEGQAKNAIAEKQREIKRLASRRGLLYSGLRQGSESSASSEIASKAAGQKAKVAPELERIAEAIDSQAAKTAQANYGDDLNLMSQVYDRALADAKSRTQMLGQLGETGGMVAGNYFGSRNPESDRYEMEKRRGY